jgi:hypothetical protein
MKPPPFLPEETLHRTLRVATMEGLSVLVVAGIIALASAAAGDYAGTAAGLLVAAAGAIELHGAGLLRAGDGRGANWLVFSQPYLMAVILGICAWQLTHLDAQAIDELKAGAHAMYGDSLSEKIAQTGMSEREYFRFVYHLTYWVVGAVTVGYQGFMTIYYVRRRDALVAAVEETEYDSD